MIPIAVGMELPPIRKTITQSAITAYSSRLGASNPIHFDPEFAARTQFGGPIASGPITLTLIDELMAGPFPREWLYRGSLKVTFLRPVRPGDTVSLGGKVATVEQADSGRAVTFDLDCVNQHREQILVGTATVVVGADASGA